MASSSSRLSGKASRYSLRTSRQAGDTAPTGTGGCAPNHALRQAAKAAALRAEKRLVRRNRSHGTCCMVGARLKTGAAAPAPAANRVSSQSSNTSTSPPSRQTAAAFSSARAAASASASAGSRLARPASGRGICAFGAPVTISFQSAVQRAFCRPYKASSRCAGGTFPSSMISTYTALISFPSGPDRPCTSPRTQTPPRSGRRCGRRLSWRADRRRRRRWHRPARRRWGRFPRRTAAAPTGR